MCPLPLVGLFLTFNVAPPIPGDRDLFTTLTNSSLTAQKRFDAAVALVSIAGDPNPVIARFNKPTVAEAILALRDAVVADALNQANTEDSELAEKEASYVGLLVRLGDKRIGPALASRVAGVTDNLDRRGNLASGAYRLGSPKPFLALLEDLRLGKLAIKQDNEEVGIRNLLSVLLDFDIPEMHRAVHALVEPKHPFYKRVTRHLDWLSVKSWKSQPWFNHPYCLKHFRKSLEDKGLTNYAYYFRGDRLITDYVGEHPFTWINFIPKRLQDPSRRRNGGAEQVRDLAALKLGQLLCGTPSFHLLLKDADFRRARIQETYDRFAGNWRLATHAEANALDVISPAYLPDIRMQGRVATVEDVKAGKAIFSLVGKATPAKLQLPAKGEIKGMPVLILQAEVGSDGGVVYGVVEAESIRSVPASEVTEVTPLAK